MDISELVFSQSHGVFFVWKMHDGNPITTFLRNRENIPLEVQIENAIADGRSRRLTLVGIGHWYLRPNQPENDEQRKAELEGIPFAINQVAATLLRLKNLPERERESTEIGKQEMRQKWIPYVCARLHKLLWGEED